MFSLDSKYSNILTMILVILIVAILGIMGYFAYSFFYTQSVNKNADAALGEFKNTTAKKPTNITSNKENKVNNENTVTNNINPEELFDILNQNNSQTPPSTDNKKDDRVMMEDYEVMGYIKIPKTGIELPILNEVTTRSLELSVGIAYGPGLNEPGNTIIFGHNYRNGMFFSDNKKIVKGDKIYITDKNNTTVTYLVYNIYETTQDDATYMERPVEEGVREISLQTCTDDSARRIVIWAKEI